MPTERVTFKGHNGDELAARLDLPDGPHLATAIFALLAGGLASWFVINGIMGFTFTLMPEIALATVVSALVFTVGFGLIGTWRVLGQKAAPVLREL